MTLLPEWLEGTTSVQVSDEALKLRERLGVELSLKRPRMATPAKSTEPRTSASPNPDYARRQNHS